MVDTKIICRSDLWSRRELLSWGLLAGLAAGFAFVVAVGATLKMRLFFPALTISGAFIIFMLVAPSLLLQRFQHQLKSGVQAVWAGVAFGLGQASIMQIIVIVIFRRGGVNGAMMFETGCLVMSFLFGAMSWGIWKLLQNCPAKVLVQDGTLCPGCGYCLISNESAVCSECGRSFTREELAF